ncbi:MAG TPA: tetratricopeptide repeat protein [Steroidobacter sp.]|nr:tetratricopeptide repeat protein [Steroidobacter sp.]
MTAFLIVAGAMVAAALVYLVLPLWRQKPASGGEAPASRSRERYLATAALVVALPALAAIMYDHLSDWDWQAAARESAERAQVEALLSQLEEKLRANPADVRGWLLLGDSYLKLGEAPRAIKAYQGAYDASGGENVDAMVGLGEALALHDEAALWGRAGALFEAALAKAPHHPRALWYGAVSALRAGDLRKGRERLQMLLAQNPPEELREMLKRQIQDLDQQLGAQGEGDAWVGERRLRVAVSIAPQIREQLPADASLFVLARDPAGGPPLAVQRHSVSAAPLAVELSEQDAMAPSRTLAAASRVEVIARISRSGSPQAQSGDFYGEADYDFNAATDAVSIVIDKTVP